MSRLLRSLGWWDALAKPGPTRVLSVNSLTDAAGSGLAAICLPFFALRVAGLSAAGLGLILSVAGACEIAAAVPAGAMAGRIGVFRYTVATKIAQVLVFGLMAVSHGFVPLLVLAAGVGVSRAGANGLSQALTVAVLGEEQRAAALGAVRALRNIGYLLAGAIGAWFLATGSRTELRIALAVNAASFAVGAVCTLMLRPQGKVSVTERTNWSVLRDWEYLGLVLAAAVFGSSLVVIDVGLPLWVLRYSFIPSWTVAVVVTLNTAIVVILQYRFSSRITQVRHAARGIRLAAVAFCVMAALLAVTPWTPALVAVGLLIVVALALTAGELFESPSWWTLSFELAPADRRTEYLSAFDLSWAVVGIAGPAAMAGVVALGPAGWLLYGCLMVAAAAGGLLLVRRRTRRLDAGEDAQVQFAT
ncbi:MAG TPA: MFS transporter [Streptosporangiaceae bacterium]